MKLGSYAHLEKLIFNCCFAKYVKTYIYKSTMIVLSSEFQVSTLKKKFFLTQ